MRFEVDTARLDAALGAAAWTPASGRCTSQPPTLEELFLRHYGDQVDA